MCCAGGHSTACSLAVLAGLGASQAWGVHTCVQAHAARCLHRLPLTGPPSLPTPIHLPPCSGKAGVTVGGKLEGGALCPGSKVLLMPAGQPATVK